MPFLLDPFGQVRGEIAQRSAELRHFWTEIRSWEVAPPAPQPLRFRTGKGLILVYNYGLLEFSVTRLVSQLTQLIKNQNVRGKDYSPSVRVLVHEPKIQSIISVSEKRGLKQRLELYKEISQVSSCSISDTILNTQVQNVWAVSIENIFLAFGILNHPFFDNAFGKRADSLVEDRNAIAHGREAPDIVGERYSSGEIDQLIADTGQQIAHMEVHLAQYFNDRLFVDQQWRHRYP